jgi:small conductance mechanosensitive channel
MKSLKDIELSITSLMKLDDTLFHEMYRWGLNLAGKLFICLVLYIIGRKVIKYIDRLVSKIMQRRAFDASVASFLAHLINIALMVALIIGIVNILGIGNSSFVALLASIGVALGMALSGTLQNFAGGVMILLFRPFKVGDYIQAQGQEGTIKEIQIFSTIIITLDNRTIYIPNGGLSSNIIVNYNNQQNRRIEWVVGVEYGTDFDKAKKVSENIIKANGMILTDPAPSIALKALNESSVDIQIRAWVNRNDYWTVLYSINEQIYKEFALHGIGIPFPQLTVHIADK